jgi:hypothetical protein
VKRYQRNYDMPPGEGPYDLKPFKALVTAAEINVLLAVVPLENPPSPEERLGVFVMNSPDYVRDDPVFRDLILEFAHNGQEQTPGTLAIATSMAAHAFAAKNMPPDED